MAGLELHVDGGTGRLRRAAACSRNDDQAPTLTTYSRRGNLLGHITIGAQMVRDMAGSIAGFPEDLRTRIEHLVVSHHGERELGSPVEPMTEEAFILSAIDDLDAQLHQVRRHVAEDTSDGEFTAYHPRFRRVLLKPAGH